MPAGLPAILEAFGVAERRCVYLIGGGGKTSLLFALAHALVDRGRKVLTTTSTRIREPESAQSPRVVIGADAASLIPRLRSEFAAHDHVTAAAARGAADKLLGLALGDLDRLAEARVADHLLVEADGSAGLSIKAHREHEPVVSPQADLVIAVVGVDCLGAPMDEAHVHRAELLRARLGRPVGALVQAEDVAAILLHRDGYLARVAGETEVAVFLNKAATLAARAEARRLAQVLLAADRQARLARVVIGDVRTAAYEPVSRRA